MIPSRIARTIAGREWPDVQSQYKLAPGIFWFTCAGHGGAVAVIGTADLPEQAVQAARVCQLVELAVIEDLGGTTRTLSTSGQFYTRASLCEWATRSDRRTLVECWVGEEDCAWATLAMCSPAMREGMERKMGCRPLSEREARETVERWHPEFLGALEQRAAA
jgi:hypothetical protein